MFFLNPHMKNTHLAIYSIKIKPNGYIFSKPAYEKYPFGNIYYKNKAKRVCFFYNS